MANRIALWIVALGSAGVGLYAATQAPGVVACVIVCELVNVWAGRRLREITR